MGTLRGRYLKLWHAITLAVVFFFGVVYFFLPQQKEHSAAEISTVSSELPPLPTKWPLFPELQSTPAPINLLARASVLIDVDSGVVLFSERPQTRVSVASTTKLMTAVVARKYLDLDRVIEVTKEQTEIIGSDMQLRPKEKLTVRSLLTGLLIVSGNDAAVVLADNVPGGQDAFVRYMNEEALALGLTSTHFLDPAGLNDDGYSTAFELSIIARYALQDDIISQIVATKETTVTSVDGRVKHELKNSNRLVGEFNYAGAIGLKTGFTPGAGHCLVAGAERNGHQLIAVILHTDAETITASAIEARKLLDWGWNNVQWKTLFSHQG